MKTIKVTELKAQLSRSLRQASRGARIVVTDRDEPIAQLGPLETKGTSWRERLAGEGRLRRGTQQWESLQISPLGRAVDAQDALRSVREDPRDRGSR